MRLKVEILEEINKPAIRLMLAQALGVTEQTVIKNIRINHVNLTKASALEVIREKLGLTDEEILTKNEEVAI